MADSNYMKELKARLSKKQKELSELYKERSHLETCHESFWNVEAGIHSLQTDIKTIKSRIENYGKGVILPNIEIPIIHKPVNN